MSQRVSGYARQPDDVYETPPWVTRIVADYLRGRCRQLWDPANGPTSRMAQTLREEGFGVVATNSDFLVTTALPYDRVDAVVTNPPYGTGGRLACQFIAHALELAPVVAMLLRVDFDSGKTRAHLFGGCSAFTHKIVLLDRVTWFEREGAAGPSENHAWFIWYAGHRGPPTIGYGKRALLDATPNIHQLAFETNRTTGEWRARCSCGWSDVQPDKARIDFAAAGHDLKEIAPRADASGCGEVMRNFAEQHHQFRKLENGNKG